MGDGRQIADSGDVGGHQVNIGEMHGNIGQIGNRHAVYLLAQPYRIPWQFPDRPVHFTGRTDLLATLRARLHPGRDITLHGPAGIGKTALTAEALWGLEDRGELRERFPDGVVSHSFYSRPETEAALEHIALSLGEKNLRPDVQAAAQRALAGRQVLLVLDGAEDADRLDRVREISGAGGVLVTSRNAQDAAAEIVRVGPLARQPEDEGVRLLREWAGDLVADERVAVEICDLVGRLPLAVRLAGRYLRSPGEPAADYLQWLRTTPLEALNQGDRQHESVDLLLARSLEQVDPSARNILGLAGRLAFAPFATEALASALQIEADEESHPLTTLRRPLASLVNYGLLLVDEDTYVLSHTLIHTFARQRLDVDDDNLARLAGYLAERCQKAWRRGPQAYPSLAAARAHALALLPHLQEAAQWDAILKMALATVEFLSARGYTSDRLVMVRAALAAARSSGKEAHEGFWLHWLGYVLQELGQPGEAISRFEEALQIYRKLDRREPQLWLLIRLANAHFQLDQFDDGLDLFNRAGEISREIGMDDRVEFQGPVYQLGPLQERLAEQRRIGDRRAELGTLGTLTGVYSRLLHREEYLEEALGYNEEGLAISREIGHRPAERKHLGRLGEVYVALGRPEEALGFFESALAISRELGDLQAEGDGLTNLGNAWYLLGRVEKAVRFMDEALTLFRELGSPQAETVRATLAEWRRGNTMKWHSEGPRT